MSEEEFSTDNLMVKCTEFSINAVIEELLKIPEVSEFRDKYYPGYNAWFGPDTKAIVKDSSIELYGAIGHYEFINKLRDKFPKEYEYSKKIVGNL